MGQPKQGRDGGGQGGWYGGLRDRPLALRDGADLNPLQRRPMHTVTDEMRVDMGQPEHDAGREQQHDKLDRPRRSLALARAEDHRGCQQRSVYRAGVVDPCRCCRRILAHGNTVIEPDATDLTGGNEV
jgi:hypothetical protein